MSAGRDPYRNVVLVLLAAAALGAVSAAYGGLTLGMPVLLDLAVTLGISAGILVGVASAQTARLKPSGSRWYFSRARKS